MFDLKAKLLEKGLVTKEQVEKVASEKEMATKKNPKLRHAAIDFAIRERQRALESLKSQSKGEAYVTIRKWIDLNRLDKPAHASYDNEKFFLTTKDNQVTWLSLRSEVIEAIKKGDAGVIAYMSNHGLAHAVVPRDIAEDVSVIFPDWLKVLHNKPS